MAGIQRSKHGLPGIYNANLASLDALADGEGTALQVDQYGRVRLAADITVGDVQLGAVEIKDGAADIRQTVLDLTNSNPAVVAIVDANGDQITSFGSTNTEYVDDADWTDNTSRHVLTGGIYQSTQQSVTDGDTAPLEIDANGNLKITAQGLGAGENLTKNRLMTLGEYSYSAVAVADVQVKGSAGTLHSVTISCNDAAPTAGSIIIYDNTAESGTVVFNHTFTTTPFMPFTIILDYTMATGIYVGFTTTADVNVSCAYL